jgi:hippurate hydrolase
VFSITQIRAGDAYNVIPQQAVLAGTARTMKSDVMATIERTMKRLAAGIAEGFGAQATVAFRNLFVPLVNNHHETTIYAAAEVVGEANVQRNSDPIMASEDFALMMQVVPGAHIMFGNGPTAAAHNQMYDFNDEAIPYGVALLATITEKKLPKAC